MPRQANGQYLPPANTAAVTATTISSTAYNTLETDIGSEITNSLDRLGRSAMQAALPMGANKITGMADPTVLTDAATKNYVDTATASFFSTGDVKLTLKSTPDSGWLMFDDGTFGSASSGSSNSNSSANLALFTLLFNSPFLDANVPILTSGGGATTRAAQVSASAAWAANCRMSLPKTLGRAIAIAGSGSGLTARALGSAVGSETATVGTANLPPYTPSGTVASTTATTVGVSVAANGGGGTYRVLTPVGEGNQGNNPVAGTTTSTFTGSAQGGTSQAFSVVPAEAFLNAMVKV